MNCNNPFSLEGKIILVSGASSGIGKSVAVEASKLGATVLVTGRNQERLNETFKLLDESKDNVQFIADLTIEEEMNKLVGSLPELDGIVLSAGQPLTLPVQFCSRDKFEQIYNINFFAPVELVRVLYKKKKLKKGASVVYVASIGGVYAFGKGNSVYGSSKAALHAIMKYSAKEFAPRKIRVNCVCPGMVETPLIHKGTITEEQLQQDMERYPLKRYGKPEEIAYGTIYLLSDASAWVTGQDVVIDGGMSI